MASVGKGSVVTVLTGGAVTGSVVTGTVGTVAWGWVLTVGAVVSCVPGHVASSWVAGSSDGNAGCFPQPLNTAASKMQRKVFVLFMKKYPFLRYFQPLYQNVFVSAIVN